jgi:hypothetical protein
MAHYLLYSGKTSETGRALVEALGIPGGSRPPAERPDIMIRWGSSDATMKPGRVVNKRRAVELATNKLLALQTMASAGVPTPRVWPADNDIRHFPVVGRRTNHTQGRDIVLCLQSRDVGLARQAGCSHFTELLPKLTEFRVHCFGDEIIKLSEKILTNTDQYNPVIWNFETGFTFRQPQIQNPLLLGRARAVGLEAVKALGLDFGAADVVVAEGGMVYCLEVNTGPSLQENTLDVYLTAIRKELGIDEPAGDTTRDEDAGPEIPEQPAGGDGAATG